MHLHKYFFGNTSQQNRELKYLYLFIYFRIKRGRGKFSKNLLFVGHTLNPLNTRSVNVSGFLT